MPVSQKVEYEGFVVQARPAFAWRRWLRFPLYFQAFRPSFEIWITKETSEPSREKRLVLNVTFSNNTSVDYPLEVGSLKQGDTLYFKTPQVLLAPTGDASIRLEMGLGRFHTLYAFFVSHETALVFLLLNVVLVAVATTVIGVLIRAS